MGLDIIDLNKSYDGKALALQNFSLSLKAGIHVLLGVNGAGKSTLINILTGNLAADSGTMSFDGDELGDNKHKFLESLGFLPQYPSFYPDFTVEEVLAYIGALKNVPEEILTGRIEQLIASLNLSQYRHYKIKHLSGGTRQRVGIAQSLLNDPQLLILDEPTSGLDPVERMRFRNLIAQIAPGKVILIATHIVSDAESIADNVIIIHRGRLLATGPVQDLCSQLEGRVIYRRADERLEPSLISRVERRGDQLWLRLIVDKEVAEKNHSEAECPDLDDVFLYYSGDTE